MILDWDTPSCLYELNPQNFRQSWYSFAITLYVLIAWRKPLLVNLKSTLKDIISRQASSVFYDFRNELLVKVAKTAKAV